MNWFSSDFAGKCCQHKRIAINLKNCGYWLVITIHKIYTIYFWEIHPQYVFFKGQTKINLHLIKLIVISFTKRAIENQTPFFYYYQGEFLGETLIQASLLMHHTLLRLGVAATELALASLYENSKSELLLELESQ
jgi:hypothetical protein